MKRFRLLLMAAFSVMCMNAFSQVELDLGSNWDPDNAALINATSEQLLVGGTSEYTLEEGTEDEVVISVVGGIAGASSNNAVYANPMPAKISYLYLTGNQTQYIEGIVTGNKKFVEVFVNGTNADPNNGSSTHAVLYSSATPFDEAAITGYEEFDLAACRAGDSGTEFSFIPDGTKSFRIYRAISLTESGGSIVIDESFNAEGETVLGSNAGHVRIAYMKVTIEDGVPPTEPSMVLTSAEGTTSQTLLPDLESLTPIVYRFGGTATSAAVTWTGTTGEGVPPAGIEVDLEGKVVTIKGTPSIIGTYGYTVTAKDDDDKTIALSGTITVQAATKPLIAYVVKSNPVTDDGDKAIIEKMKEWFTVSLILSSTTGVDFTPYEAVVIAALPGSGDAGMKELKGLDKPMVNLKPFQLQASRWAWGTPVNVEAASAEEMVNTIIVQDEFHPIFEGIDLSDNAEVAMASGSAHAKFRVLTPMNAWVGDNEFGTVTLATAKGYVDNPDAAVISEFEVGAVMEDDGVGDIPVDGGVTISQKYIQIGVSEQAAKFLTEDYLQIVNNSIAYVLDLDPTELSIEDAAQADVNKVEVGAEYYDLMGRKISSYSAKGVVIKKSIYEDGSVSFGKVYIYK